MMTSEDTSAFQFPIGSTSQPSMVTLRGIGLTLFVLLCVGLGVTALLVKPIIIAGVLIAVFLGLLIMLYPFFGLLVLYLDLIVAPAVIWPQLGALHPDAALGGILFASVAIHKKLKGAPIILFQDRMTILLILFTGALAASVPTSVWPTNSVTFITSFLTTVMFYILMLNVLTTERRLIGFVLLFILSSGYTAISSALAYFQGNLTVAQGIERAQSLAGADPNTLAVSLVLSVPFMVFIARWTKSVTLKLVAVLLALASAFTISITGSRSGVMGLLAVLFFIWLTLKHRMLTLAIFLLLIAVGWVVLPQQYKERYSSVTSVTTGEVDPSTQARYDAWHAGLRMFVARPVFGIGVGNFAVAYASGDYSDRGYWLKAHSLYIQLIAELGTVGVLTFVPLIIYMIRRNFLLRKEIRQRRAEAGAVLAVSHAITCSIGALFITSLSGHSLFRMHWYWCCALTVVIWRIFRDSYPELPVSRRWIPFRQRTPAPSDRRPGTTNT